MRRTAKAHSVDHVDVDSLSGVMQAIPIVLETGLQQRGRVRPLDVSA